MKLPHRRQFLHRAAGAAAVPVLSRLARAQPYPRRPVRIIVGFAPAGATETFTRLIGQWFSERLGQKFDVENRQVPPRRLCALRRTAIRCSWLPQRTRLTPPPLFWPSHNHLPVDRGTRGANLASGSPRNSARGSANTLRDPRSLDNCSRAEGWGAVPIGPTVATHQLSKLCCARPTLKPFDSAFEFVEALRRQRQACELAIFQANLGLVVWVHAIPSWTVAGTRDLLPVI